MFRACAPSEVEDQRTEKEELVPGCALALFTRVLLRGRKPLIGRDELRE